MMENIKKGKKIVIGIIILVLSTSVIVTALSSALMYASGDLGEAVYELAQGTFRFILECLLCLFIYKGHRWAKIVMIVLLIIAAIIGLVTSITVSLLMLVLAVVDIVCVVLLLGKPVKDYQNYKKNGSRNDV